MYKRQEVISGTILDNIRLGRPNVDTRRVREALASVGLLADVDAMPEKVGQRIAMLRHERGRTQAQLASAAGLTEQYVHRIESGFQNPSLKVLARLARALDVSLPEVVRIGEPPRNSGS